MSGSIMGNFIAMIYFAFFQMAGLLFAWRFFRQESFPAKLLAGSVTGSLLLTWMPILTAFLFDFTILAHIVAAVITAVLLAGFLLFFKPSGTRQQTFVVSNRMSFKNHVLFFILLSLYLTFWCYLLHTHTILPNEDGGIYTGQCTYGDMNMHLGFITSLAVQQTFPPDYSIMPGVRLSYPFLSDSISSSLYCLGASLRLSYILPMVFAMAQIVTAVYVLAETLFASLRKSMLTLTFFFLNGGLGFVYFVDWSNQRDYTFESIFTGFYTTPTNLVDQNIRWVNVIADMFLPQRATLFGYAVLFPALWLLYRAVFQSEKKYFLPAGLFVAALPMIHTHSFLSAGIISASWLLLWLFGQVHGNTDKPIDAYTTGTTEYTASKANSLIPNSVLPPVLFTAFLVIMCILQSLQKKAILQPQTLMVLGISLFIAAVIYGIYLLTLYFTASGDTSNSGPKHTANPLTARNTAPPISQIVPSTPPLRDLLAGWGVYLLPILLLALPQLLFWTFGQVAQGSFVRGHFNWGNLGDFYPWFYLKNIGVILFLIIGAIWSSTRKRTPLFLPVLFLWWLGELIVFTPNTYDNNKLLYVAYLLLCLAAADHAVELYDALKGIPARRIFAGLFLFCSIFSAILTLGREKVSEYQLYNPSQTALAKYIEENTAPDAVFLTNTRHNNEIASLTGRNIVCGADSFLYFHGLDTTERKNDLRLMYEAPAENMALFSKYNVDYIVISGYEKSSYSIDKSQFDSRFTTVFTSGDVTLYRVTP